MRFLIALKPMFQYHVSKEARVYTLCLFIFSLLWSSTASAQLWSGLLDPSRATDWTQTGVTGGIPNRNTICATINPPATAATINAAIQSCSASGGGVVLLGPGTFTLSEAIGMVNSATPGWPSARNVTVRGAGPDLTTLQFSDYGGNYGLCGAEICFASASVSLGACGIVVGQNTANWTGNYTAGSTQITLDNTTGNFGGYSNSLAVGMYITLDQLNSPAGDATAYRPFVFYAQPYGNPPYDAQGTGRPNRMIAEMHKVIAISGSTVTISPPLAYQYWNINGNNQPQAWWCDNINQLPAGNGVENLTVNNQAGRNPNYIVAFQGAAQSWLKNVRLINGPRAFVGLRTSSNVEIRDSYFYQTIPQPLGLDATGCARAGTMYGIEIFYAGFVKFENNILQQTCAAVTNQPCFVCVIGYNYMVGNLPYQDYTTGIKYGTWVNGIGHAGAVHNVLFEGNDTVNLNFDHSSAEGSSASLSTIFRNRFSGDFPGVSSANEQATIMNQGYERFNSFIGNILGTPGTTLAYENSANVNATVYPTTYNLGWGCGAFETGCSVPKDLITISSMMRWGNFDYNTNNVRWCGNSSSPGWSTICNSKTEIPTDNPVPSMTLPPSLYLYGKPAWFGSIAWPIIGPDVTGGTDVSGHAGNNPAKACYLNVMKGSADGSGSILTFNATTCYGSTTNQAAPAAPTGLKVS
jgi:hypothetical protein